MTAKQPPANGAAITSAAGMLTAPGFLLSQKLALEAARFSAQRIRALADQMEAVARCENAPDLIAVHTRFVQQTVADYVAEGETMRDMFATAADEATSNGQGGGSR